MLIIPGVSYSLILSILFIPLFSTGCATFERLENPEGTGTKKVFQRDFEVVWKTSVNVLEGSSLRIDISDKGDGFILAKRELGSSNWSEKVAVFVRRLSGRATTVEVLSKTSVPGNSLAMEWPEKVLAGISRAFSR